METPQKPNIKNLPEGYDIRWNPISSKWQMYCVKGFSEKYLSKNADKFIPKPPVAKAKVGGKKGKNESMLDAKRIGYDEFYTRKEDIAEEVIQYKEYFKGKTVYCPCDKVYNLGMSNFFVFFATYFKELGLEKLICTQYNPEGHGTVKSITACTVSELESRGIKWEWHGENGGDKLPDESEIPIDFLMGDGSFDSEECKKIMLGESGDGKDVIVCTNPPFSKWKEFIKQVMDCGCGFLVLSNQNAITYKETFQYIRDNKMWIGYKPLGSEMFFHITDEYKEEIVKKKKEGSGWKVINGEIMARVAVACWFTNLSNEKRTNELYLSETYKGNEEKYPNVVNMANCIDIGHWKKNGKWEGKLDMIPKDYPHTMAVPITFLGKYNPEQFEIVGCPDADVLPEGWNGMPQWFIDAYYNQGNTGSYKEGNRLDAFVKDEKAVVAFKRLLIKNKKI